MKRRKAWESLSSETKRFVTKPVSKQLQNLAEQHSTEMERVAANIVRRWVYLTKFLL